MPDDRSESGCVISGLSLVMTKKRDSIMGIPLLFYLLQDLSPDVNAEWPSVPAAEAVDGGFLSVTDHYIISVRSEAAGRDHVVVGEFFP